jgi:hypothetical protein
MKVRKISDILMKKLEFMIQNLMKILKCMIQSLRKNKLILILKKSFLGPKTNLIDLG